MWMPERVWEQSLTTDLAAAGIEYTVLDDFHFKNAGLVEEQLDGYYITEDDGRHAARASRQRAAAVPHSVRRAAARRSTTSRSIGRAQPGAVVVFGDDGEKFGTWPDTKKHVYDDGWLRQFFDALLANSDWLNITTLSEAIDNVPPLGKIYLPDGSYREMTEWALPAEQQQSSTNDVVHELEHDGRVGRASSRSSAAASGGTSR